MRTIDKIYIHCSASLWGNFDLVDKWHKERAFTPWADLSKDRTCYVGYHFLVLNPFPTESDYKKAPMQTSTTDGQLVPARPLSIVGCQVAGDNHSSIGICYIGLSPTPLQVESMFYLCSDLILEHNINIDSGVLGHHEYYDRIGKPREKTCPNFNMESFRAGLEFRLNVKLK